MNHDPRLRRSTETYSYYAVLPVVLGLVEEDGKVLLGRRANRPYRDRWDLPGGRVRPGEPLEDAVKREVVEETKLDIFELRLEGAYHYPGNEGSPAIFLLYRLLSIQGKMETTGELPLLQWFNHNELQDLDLTPWSRHFLLERVFDTR